MGNAAADPEVGISLAHRDWSRRLTELRGDELREQVRHVMASAAELGVWERGGYVPLQPFIVGAAASNLVYGIGSQLRELQIGHALSRVGGDLNRLADIAEWRDECWFLRTGRPLADALGAARSDIFISGGRPNFLEINIGTCLTGATTSSVLSTALLESPVGVEMRRAHHIRASSYLDALSHWIQQRYSADSPNVALLAYPDQGDEGSLQWVAEHATRLAAHGIPCDFVPVGEGEIVNNALCWQGKRYGLAIRYFMVPPEADNLDFFRALEGATDTVLLGSYVAQLFASKNLLADLYQDDRLTASQRRVLDHVPWIARLTPGFARRGAGRVDPVEWAAANREHAVLKPGNLFGSRGLVVGRLASEPEWRGALEAAVREGGYVVQELVRPDTWPNVYWHIESETLVNVDTPVLLGPFVVDGADGGVYTQQPIKGTEDELRDPNREVSLGCVASA